MGLIFLTLLLLVPPALCNQFYLVKQHMKYGRCASYECSDCVYDIKSDLVAVTTDQYDCGGNYFVVASVVNDPDIALSVLSPGPGGGNPHVTLCGSNVKADFDSPADTLEIVGIEDYAIVGTCQKWPYADYGIAGACKDHLGDSHCQGRTEFEQYKWLCDSSIINC